MRMKKRKDQKKKNVKEVNIIDVLDGKRKRQEAEE
jgi:hypothetical protein